MARPPALVVEDTPEFAQLSARLLEAEGFSVTVVGDGEVGLELARRLRPELVVLDVTLPGLDGLEVCRRIREFSDCYVVMVTARDDELDRVLGLTVGADDYVTKPFSPRELAARIKAMRRRPRAGRGPAAAELRRAGRRPGGAGGPAARADRRADQDRARHPRAPQQRAPPHLRARAAHGHRLGERLGRGRPRHRRPPRQPAQEARGERVRPADDPHRARASATGSSRRPPRTRRPRPGRPERAPRAPRGAVGGRSRCRPGRSPTRHRPPRRPGRGRAA